jgi:hypothetical protein
VQFIEHSRQYQQEQHILAKEAGEPYAVFSIEMIENLRKCIKVVCLWRIQRRSALMFACTVGDHGVPHTEGLAEEGSEV